MKTSPLSFSSKKTLPLNPKTVLFEQVANVRGESFENKKVNFKQLNFATKTNKLCFQ
jgi:hypothetical protein